MSFTLDASVTMAWCFEDETDAYTDSVLDRLQSTEAIVPAIWPLEVVNVLLGGLRHGRVTEARALRFLQFLQALPIEVDPAIQSVPLAAVLHLARSQQLSSYDAAYLELAIRGGLPLATKDQRLRAAAGRTGVSLVE
jgi:predicted nucleic acid-binding protein